VSDDVGDAILHVIADATGRPDLEFDRQPEPLTGGFYAQMFRFSLRDPPDGLEGELVGRVIPDEQLGAWESCVQQELTRQRFRSPAVRLTVPPAPPLDRCLIVMDFVAGEPPLSGLTVGGLATQIPRLVRTLPDQLALVSSDLHRLDAAPLAQQLERLGTTLPTTLHGFLQARIDAADSFDRADLASAGRRLLESEPPTTTRVICHGDLHPLNLLVTDDGMTLVDWSVSRIAHPGFDLAFTELMVANPPIPMPGVAQKLLRPVAKNIAGRFLRTYREIAAPVPDLDDAVMSWHRKVHALRALVELAGWDAEGGRPTSAHPWIVLEPVLTGILRS
jgi:aminoglycoside phosphotransferase (APT) family kinase protein